MWENCLKERQRMEPKRGWRRKRERFGGDRVRSFSSSHSHAVLLPVEFLAPFPTLSLHSCNAVFPLYMDVTFSTFVAVHILPLGLIWSLRCFFFFLFCSDCLKGSVIRFVVSNDLEAFLLPLKLWKLWLCLSVICVIISLLCMFLFSSDLSSRQTSAGWEVTGLPAAHMDSINNWKIKEKNIHPALAGYYQCASHFLCIVFLSRNKPYQLNMVTVSVCWHSFALLWGHSGNRCFMALGLF